MIWVYLRPTPVEIAPLFGGGKSKTTPWYIKISITLERYSNNTNI